MQFIFRRLFTFSNFQVLNVNKRENSDFNLNFPFFTLIQFYGIRVKKDKTNKQRGLEADSARKSSLFSRSWLSQTRWNRFGNSSTRPRLETSTRGSPKSAAASELKTSPKTSRPIFRKTGRCDQKVGSLRFSYCLESGGQK